MYEWFLNIGVGIIYVCLVKIKLVIFLDELV